MQIGVQGGTPVWDNAYLGLKRFNIFNLEIDTTHVVLIPGRLKRRIFVFSELLSFALI